VKLPNNKTIAMKKSLFLTAITCATAWSIVGASAQTQASSKPMGYVTYNALGNSDTRIGAPVHRKAAFVGKVDSVGGAGSNEITVDGTSPGWAVDAFTDPTMASPPASELYYVLIASGNMEGRYFEVLGNDADTLTIDLAGVLPATFTTEVVNGTSIKLIPYWTLNTLFPDGKGVHASQNFGVLNSTVLAPSTMSAGTNLSNSATYYYYDGSIPTFPNARWQKAGVAPADWDNQPLSPDVQLIVRNNIAGDTQIVPIGDVFTTKFKTLVNILAAGVDQDNAVFLTVPVDVSLTDSNLFESGAFAGNSTFLPSNSDTLIIYDNTTVGKNKSNSKTYFYYTGAAAGGPGWRQGGTAPTIIRNNDIAFSLDTQALIRKKGAAMGSSVWEMTPSYLPLP